MARRRAFTLMAGMAITVSSVVVATPATADTNGWLQPTRFWTANSTTLHVQALGYYNNWGAWGKDYVKMNQFRAQAGRASGGDTSNGSSIKTSITFSGVGLSVGVGYPVGASVQFTRSNNTCQHATYHGNHNWVSINMGSGTVCSADTWGWVSGAKVEVEGGLRYGGSWNLRVASASVKLGG